jgi:GntR family transcriptional regulator
MSNGEAARSVLGPARRPAELAARSPMPLWHRVYLVLRGRIEAGRYEPEGRLPSEHEIVAEFGVARVTARRALAELEAEGWIERAPGRGTRLRPQAGVREVHATLEGLFENLLAMGLETRVRLLACEERPAPPAIARAAGFPAGTPMLYALRVRSSESGPFSHLETWVPAEIGARIGREALATTPLLVLLERAGVRVARADQTVSARLAEPQVAPLLEVPVGAPLLEITRLVFDETGRMVEHITGLYRPDRYRLRMALDRARAGGTRTWVPRRGPEPVPDPSTVGPREEAVP